MKTYRRRIINEHKETLLEGEPIRSVLKTLHSCASIEAGSSCLCSRTLKLYTRTYFHKVLSTPVRPGLLKTHAHIQTLKCRIHNLLLQTQLHVCVEENRRDFGPAGLITKQLLRGEAWCYTRVEEPSSKVIPFSSASFFTSFLYSHQDFII